MDGVGLGRAFALMLIAVLSTAACEAFPAGPAGPAVPAGPVDDPQFICVGVPQAACRGTISGGVDPSMPPVVQVVVRCTRPICTDLQGEAEVTFVFDRGQRHVWTYGWENVDTP